MSVISSMLGGGAEGLKSGWDEILAGLSGEHTREGVEEAAKLQLQGIQEALGLQREQWQEARAWMEPYMQAGVGALDPLRVLSGAGSAAEEQAMLRQIQDSPTMQAMIKQGEDALLQSASVTGGLRGGNTAAALAQFRPAMLRSEIENRYSRLANMAGMGQATSVGGVSASQQAAQGMSGIIQSGAEGQANAAMAAAQSRNSLFNNMMQLGAMYAFASGG